MVNRPLKQKGGIFLSEQIKPGGCVNMPSAVSGQSPLDSLPLAMSYVPMRRWESLYDPEVGLERGTIFACLDLPFVGKEATSNGND